jgi:hypothetical protein
MRKRLSVRVCTICALIAAFACAATPARAQYRPRPLNDPATGEQYHIEAAAGFWIPTADITIQSESLGIVGSVIDLKNDLGLTDQRFPAIQLVLRPATSHKFRFEYIPIKYDQSASPIRDIIFNGIRYPVSIPVSSTLDWKAYRLAYEYDFIVKNRGFAGFILEAKYTDVAVTLTSPKGTDFVHARAPIPAIGGIGRVYVVPNISITADISGFKLPEKLIKGSTGHYIDVDVYGTLNFTNNFGAQFGYRSFDVGYVVTNDTGSFKLKGLYFGAVARY